LPAKEGGATFTLSFVAPVLSFPFDRHVGLAKLKLADPSSKEELFLFVGERLFSHKEETEAKKGKGKNH